MSPLVCNERHAKSLSVCLSADKYRIFRKYETHMVTHMMKRTTKVSWLLISNFINDIYVISMAFKTG